MSLARLTPAAILLLAGCAPVPPAVVPVEGTLTMDDLPLPNARVEFVPDLKHFGAEYNSSAVTDEAGHFVLVCAQGQQPGAAVAVHKVLVTEHTPDDLRGASTQSKLADYRAGLKNRPIPPRYGTLAQTPLVVEVKGPGVYELKLSRNP